jgi:O-antigen ligase
VLAWAAVCIVGVSSAATAALAGRAYDSFRTPQTFGTQGADARLLSLSGQNRAEYWDVAFDDYGAHPLLGSGAGTYDLYWTRDRPFGVGARDAHSLYVEALAELGPVGLALLLAALAAPFFALPRVRHRWYAAPLAGAYAAFLVHAGVDWDWELPTVTIAALACAAALATSSAESVVVRTAVRTAAAVAAAALVLVALALQVGNNALAASQAALRSGNHDEAVTEAARASRWAPWTAQAWQVRSDAERALGDRGSALRSSRRAVRRDPDDWTGWYRLARLASGDERVDAAARVRELNPLAPPLDVRIQKR